MVSLFKTKKGAVARFGRGTVRIHSYVLKSRYGGQVELTQCLRTKPGPTEVRPLEDTNKIVLDFSNRESVDILIRKLQDLKEQMGSK